MDTAAIDAYKYKINSFNNGYIHLTIENKFHLLSYNTIVDIQSFCIANKYRFSTINITKKYLHFIIITDWTNEYDANPWLCRLVRWYIENRHNGDIYG